MSNSKVIATAAELQRIQLKLTEAVEQTPPTEADGDLTQIEKAQLQANLPRALDAIQQAEAVAGVLSSPSNQLASLVQSLVVENPTALEPLPNGLTIEAKFDTHDWKGWARVLIHMLRDAKKKFSWQKAPPEPETVQQFGNSSRLAVFSDWATGLYGAPVIAKTITEEKKNIDIVIHLGDVYYSGTASEFQGRFTTFWPRRPDALHRSLNGNHEMYSGGRPYFDTIQKPPFNQKATYFAYRNDNWIIVGLDTAFEDHNLTNDQVEWLNRVVAGAEGRKIVLFSHHQPFSLLSGQGPKLKEKLKTILEGKKIFAWYWGHEHECVIYDHHDGWNLYGRCVGHAGMPEVRPKAWGAPVKSRQLRRLEKKGDVPGALVLDGPNLLIPKEEEKFTPHGFVTLEFDGPRLVERYHDPDGKEFHSAELK
ncbi:MAG TPA: metallophosphoesterase [Candidatus Angelobacter sp.]|jgi:predicted phosphodiesterase|nr:metallophosphoesterase [Candidatus Angelobacter sp.]